MKWYERLGYKTRRRFIVDLVFWGSWIIMIVYIAYIMANFEVLCGYPEIPVITNITIP